VQVAAQTIALADDGLKPIGQGIDLFYTTLSHSCEGNAFMFLDRGEVRVRNNRLLKAGEELTLAFIKEESSVEDRRTKLEERYGFKCECKR
jgi:hypothetical protein